MTRYVLDVGAALRLAKENSEIPATHELLAPTLFRSQILSALHESVTQGEMTAEVARDRLAYVGRLPMRLLGDAVLRRRAWELADQLGGRRPTTPNTSPSPNSRPTPSSPLIRVWPAASKGSW
jgi:hypothetical protein